jgi:transglutaminase-like putative cysteine protease
MTPARLTPERLAWTAACLGLALIPHVTVLPLWILITVAAAVAIRILLAVRGRDAPPTALRMSVAVLAVALLFLQFRTFNGITAGTALLSLMAGLKLLEARTNRDVCVVILIVYFLSLAALLTGNSFWLLTYLIGVCWFTCATLLRLTVSGPGPGWRASLRYSARILAHAAPLALVLWLFFPRFGGPLWQVPDDGRNAESGLGDSMSPGDITDLALSDEVAFHVRFEGKPPPAQERYWRGPVLYDFDGRTWRRGLQSFVIAPRLAPLGPPYRYLLSLEPHRHPWIFALDWPMKWDLGRGFVNGDYMLVQPGPVSRPIDVDITSYTAIKADGPLSHTLRRRDTRLPEGRNPRTVQWSKQLRSEFPDDGDYVRAILRMFHEQEYYYTLTPPRLANDSVDEFLFDTRRGFCGHYASAFAMLMRTAGIPARVVTGYLGGTYNRYSDTWILRQSDAHAWVEIWSEASGWLRIDPTAAVAPERVDPDLNDALQPDERRSLGMQGHAPWLLDLGLRLDALRQLWRERILQFDQKSQEDLLRRFNIPEPSGQKLVLLLTAGLALTLAWLTWQVRRELTPRSKDALIRGFTRLCKKLAAVGLDRRPHEGAESYAARVSVQRPDLAGTVTLLCRRYSELRYGNGRTPADVARFVADVRAFRPAKAGATPNAPTPSDFRGS